MAYVPNNTKHYIKDDVAYFKETANRCRVVNFVASPDMRSCKTVASSIDNLAIPLLTDLLHTETFHDF